MNKQELISAASEASGIPQILFKKCLPYLLNEIIKALENGEKVTLAKFGTFITVKRKGKVPPFPLTFKNLVPVPKRIIRFKQSPMIKLSIIAKEN